MKTRRDLVIAKSILSKISARWPVAEQVRGVSPAVATLIIPQVEWNALTRNEQISLTFYAESMVGNYRHVRDGFWEIVVGRIKDEDVMNLMVDNNVVRGDEFWDSEQEKFGVRASAFRQFLLD
jgi:hypothetical protein